MNKNELNRVISNHRTWLRYMEEYAEWADRVEQARIDQDARGEWEEEEAPPAERGECADLTGRSEMVRE